MTHAIQSTPELYAPGAPPVASAEQLLAEANRIIAEQNGVIAGAYAALRSAAGYLLNAKIDLETGAPKRTALMTAEGGLKVVRAAIAKIEGK